MGVCPLETGLRGSRSEALLARFAALTRRRADTRDVALVREDCERARERVRGV
jgi:hypothetical protein